MDFIKGIPALKKSEPDGSGVYYEKTSRVAYINPRVLENAVYDPEHNVTGITIKGKVLVFDGDIMREYEEREGSV